MGMRLLVSTRKGLFVVEGRGREAKLVGQDLIDFLRKKLDIPAKIRILGPMTLPCKSKQDQLGGYISRIARPLPGESIDKASRIKVFVYRTEC